MRACADLAEQARARRDHDAARAAQTAAGELASWVEQMAGRPFTDHPFVATIPAERATWDAERTRLAGPSDPGAWHAAAKTWESLGCPHRAGYAWWRQAEAQLDAGQPATAATAALRAAAAAADGHAPLLAQIRALAQRARIPLQAPPPPPRQPARPPTRPPLRADRTGAAVLRLLGGRPHQRPDRRRAVHQPQDRRRARHQHLAQARRHQPGAGRRPGRTRRAAASPAVLNTRAGNLKTRQPNTARPAWLGRLQLAPP